MRTELQAKFIQHLNSRKQDDKGFTLVELLVVIIIIGILAAIALPNFLSQGAKAKQSEAKQNVALVNKSQNSFRSENKAFATSFDILAIGSVTGGADSVTTERSNYLYSIAGTTENATVVAAALDTSLKGYSGANIRYDNGTSQSVIGTVMCENIAIGTGAPTAPVVSGILVAPVCDDAIHTTLSI